MVISVHLFRWQCRVQVHDTSVVSFDYGMDEQSKLFGHASWKFEKEADLLLSTLVGLTSIQSGHDIRNYFKSTSVPCSLGAKVPQLELSFCFVSLTF